MDSHHNEQGDADGDIAPEAPTVRRGEGREDAPRSASAGSEAAVSLGDQASGESHVAAAATSDLEEAKTVIRRSGSSSIAAGEPGLAQVGQSPADVAGVLLGQELNHFRVEQSIGGGGMGAVFKARDTRLDRVVAIKVVPRVGEDADLLRRFRNEAQSAARLDHRNIARVYDVGRHEQWHYIVFEYIEGINLRDLVARDGVLSIDDAVFYTRQVAQAVQHADQRGVVHRDIKPSNVLIRADGQVKLVDMGLARSLQLEVSADLTASGVTLGTFDYISPEQAHDPRDADVRSDIYSLGCTLYFVLTGRPPFPGGTVLQKLLSHGNTPPPDPIELRPEVSDNLSAILRKMLAKRPADRYGNPLDLIADLNELAIRENLSRAQSVGMVAVSSGTRWPTLLERHLPWVVASLLLVVSVAWLKVLSSVENVDAKIPAPPAVTRTRAGAGNLPAKTTGQGERAERAAPPSAPADPAPTNLAERPASPSAASEEAAPTAPPVTDSSQLPPTYANLPQPFDFQAMAGDASAETMVEPPVAEVPPTRIRVGAALRELSPATLPASSLQEAIALAQANQISRIEVAESLRCDEPLRIRQERLEIVGLGEGVEIRFEQIPLFAMQRAIMIDLADSRVRFENLRFNWAVPSGAVNGGALFALSANRGVELKDCAITIANPQQREAIYAFDIATDQPAASRSSDETGVGPPLVVISLADVIARGQMTLLHMDVAAQLQFLWENGFLAVSRRLLETGGATGQPQVGLTQLKIVMDHVTASVPMGLVFLRLGPSGPRPVLIDRELTDCAITTEMGAAHVELRGLQDASAAGQYVSFRGGRNHYDTLPGRSDQMLWATDQEDGSR